MYFLYILIFCNELYKIKLGLGFNGWSLLILPEYTAEVQSTKRTEKTVTKYGAGKSGPKFVLKREGGLADRSDISLAF